jgi:hypothetical protein
MVMSIPFPKTLVSGIGVLALFTSAPLAAQSPLSVAAIGQIADAVLSTLVPPDSSLSRVSVSKRTIAFDYDRTLSLFERAGTPHTSTNLHLQTPVIPASRALLDDCSQALPKPCASLGWRVYSWLEPISISDDEVIVRAHFQWPDRGSAQFSEGSAPNGHAYLVGFDTDVHLTPVSGGNWRVSGLGKTYVGD